MKQMEQIQRNKYYILPIKLRSAFEIFRIIRLFSAELSPSRNLLYIVITCLVVLVLQGMYMALNFPSVEKKIFNNLF